ncbi:hypothetical protein ACQCR9_26600, partial [Ralstonia pseudosolanacearum]
MSNNGDLKPEGPPTLFESQSETDENGHTRILASLEGRVGASGKAPQKKGRRYGIAAAVAVLVAGIGAWLVFSPSRLGHQRRTRLEARRLEQAVVRRAAL